jgi:GNAT superfamily N-acetyltransferase
MVNTSGTSIDIRCARQSDSTLLAELGAETFVDAFGADNTADDMQRYLQASFSPDIQAAELADPSAVCLIAEVDGQPAGYARLREGRPSLRLDASAPIELVRFYARTPWIGRGIGAALMKASLHEAAVRGCDVIWLGVWERNQRAIDFYRKWGFLQVGNQRFVLGNDLQNDLLMARPI